MGFLLHILTLIFVCANASKEDLKPWKMSNLMKFSELEPNGYAEIMAEVEKMRKEKKLPTFVDGFEYCKKPEVMEQEAHNLDCAFIREKSLEESILDISAGSPRKDFKFVAPEAHQISGDSARINYIKIEDPAKNKSRTRSKSPSSSRIERPSSARTERSAKRNNSRTRTKSPSSRFSNIFPSYLPDPSMDTQTKMWMTELAVIFKMENKTDQQKEFEFFVNRLSRFSFFCPHSAMERNVLNAILEQRTLIKSSSANTKQKIINLHKQLKLYLDERKKKAGKAKKVISILNI